MKQEGQQEQPAPFNKATKKYDKVSNKIRKLLGATCQTFIPELCQALKQDWYPYLSEEQVKSDKKIRDSIRDKILEDWSKDNVFNNSQDNLWLSSTITVYLPDWLRNPIQQTESNRERLLRLREEKIRKKSLISEHEKKKLEQVAEELPDSTIVPEEETTSSLTEDDMQVLGVAPYGETGRSLMALKGDISYHAYKLFEALTNNKSVPNEDDDLLNDYIKPSREFRRGLMLEGDDRGRILIHNALHFASVAIEDMIEIIDDIDRREGKK